MESLRVTLFGRFGVQCGREGLEGFELAKVQELFCYLLLYRDRPHAREVLASLLWDHCTTGQSKAYLRKVLWQLQQALGHAPGYGHVLQVEADWVQLSSGPPLWVDLDVFERAYAGVKGTPGRAFTPGQAQALEAAVDLYTGDLLASWYQDWCLFERERTQHMYLVALDKLVDYCEASSAYTAGLEYGERILYVDRAREHTHRRLMQLRYMAGDRTGALRQYERCAAALKEELDVRPARSTVQLYESIRADRLEPVGEAPAAEEAADASPSLVDRLARIKVLQQKLLLMQEQIQHEVEAVERALQRHPS